jgi:hypothetical protein
MIMKKFIGFLLSVLVINCQIGWVWAAQHDVQLLVLSEIEDRIAGRMGISIRLSGNCATEESL